MFDPPRWITGGKRCRANVCETTLERETNMVSSGVELYGEVNLAFPPVDRRRLNGVNRLFFLLWWNGQILELKRDCHFFQTFVDGNADGNDFWQFALCGE